MSKQLSRYTLRVTQDLLDKVRFIAESNGRSANKEIEQLLLKYVADFESENGVIQITDD